jgi:hypothetical protein
MANIYSSFLPESASFEERAEWYARQRRPAYFVGLDLGNRRISAL